MFLIDRGCANLGNPAEATGIRPAETNGIRPASLFVNVDIKLSTNLSTASSLFSSLSTASSAVPPAESARKVNRAVLLINSTKTVYLWREFAYRPNELLETNV